MDLVVFKSLIYS